MSITKLMQDIEGEFEEVFPPVNIGYDGCLADQIRVDKFRDYLHSAQTRLLEGIIKELPLKMGKCNETGHDMITQYVDGYNACLSDIISKLREQDDHN